MLNKRSVSSLEILNAREDFVKTEADKLIKSDLTGLFAMLNGEEEQMLQTLYRGSMCDLVYLVETFRARMNHEARGAALRAWTPTEETRAILAMLDGRME